MRPREATAGEYWDRVYQRDPSELSWYEAEPKMSLALIDELGIAPGQSVVDVGGGASPLAGRLLDRGFQQITVLDISAVALAVAKSQLGSRADRVTWVALDVRTWRPEQRFDLWHDRAVFHFLVQPDDRRRYLETLTASLAPVGAVILATFAPDSPDHCSGLPVARYNAAAIATLLQPALQLVSERRQDTTTPTGDLRPLTWTTFRARR